MPLISLTSRHANPVQAAAVLAQPPEGVAKFVLEQLRHLDTAVVLAVVRARADATASHTPPAWVKQVRKPLTRLEMRLVCGRSLKSRRAKPLCQVRPFLPRLEAPAPTHIQAHQPPPPPRASQLSAQVSRGLCCTRVPPILTFCIHTNFPLLGLDTHTTFTNN